MTRKVIVTAALISEAESVGWTEACVRRMGTNQPGRLVRITVGQDELFHREGPDWRRSLPREGGWLTPYLNQQIVFEFDSPEEI